MDDAQHPSGSSAVVGGGQTDQPSVSEDSQKTADDQARPVSSGEAFPSLSSPPHDSDSRPQVGQPSPEPGSSTQPSPFVPQSSSPTPTVVPPTQVQIQPPSQTVVTSPPSKVISPVPTESATEFQDRMVKTEQMREVKRVKRTYKLENAVGVLFGTIEASLAVRLIFKLLGARASNAFVNILYQFTGIFANPFSGIFGGNPSFGNFELDLAAIIAMVIYAIVGFGVLQLAKLF